LCLHPWTFLRIAGYSKGKDASQEFIQGLGMVMDFKDLKSIVLDSAIRLLDHKLILSKAYLDESKNNYLKEELVIFDAEPTAENLLLFLKMKIAGQLPQEILLVSLKLWETNNSFAEWSAG
jgi:6-pyruvoyltetrahydropterin/6-carboxytetrahydropterin synthase